MQQFANSRLWLVVSTLVVLLCVGCEQTIDVDLPYNKLIVINTFVGGEIDSLAWISRTLPAIEKPTYENAAIMNAVANMYWRDTVYPLVAIPSKRAYALPPGDARWQGDSLTMVVEWEGLRAESKARVPIAPSFVSARYEQDPVYSFDGTLFVTLRTRPGSVIWFEPSGSNQSQRRPPMTMYEYYRLIPGRPEDPELEVTVSSGNFYFFNDRSDTLHITMYAADAAYARFLDEPSRNNDDPFSFGGATTYTNIQGQGIGMFVPVVSVPLVIPIR